MTFVEFIQKRSVPVLLRQMNQATSLDAVRAYEDKLAASMLSSMAVAATILDLSVRLTWGDPIVAIIITGLVFMIMAVLVDYSAWHIKQSKTRSYLMSIAFMGVYINVFFSYYNRIGIVLWTGLFVLILISAIRTEYTVFVSLAFMTFFLIWNSITYRMNDEIQLNLTYYLTQLLLFAVVFIVGGLWNAVLTKRLRAGLKRYEEVLEAKEEITQLYEEVSATEEELREQNTQLIAYNEEIQKSHERLNYMAYNDALTGLPNRKFIIERMELLIKEREAGGTFAIVFIDLDGFKKINDTMGHYIGDQFLKAVSERLTKAVSHDNIVGRFGGDEFAVLIQNESRLDQVYELVEAMRDVHEEPYDIGDQRLYSSASFGIAFYPLDAPKADDLLKAADVAMYKAKATGKNSIEFFQKNMHEEILAKIAMEQELVSAIKNQEFFLVYQPQYNLEQGRITGFEALIRWQSPKRGLVFPTDFIPLLEEMKAIIEVGDWVLDTACQKIADLRQSYDYPLKMSINVSPIQMEDDHFVNGVIEAVKTYKIQPGELVIEITEGLFIKQLDQAIQRVEALKACGVEIALDDFGTGYSSLSYLRRLPIDVLKIDKSFIDDLDKGIKEQKIVGTLIDLVHDLDIEVIAEGVETEDQMAYLRRESCDHIQGYYISKPLKQELIDDKIRQYK